MQHILFVSNFFIGFIATLGVVTGMQNLSDSLSSNEVVTFERVIFLSEDDQASDTVCSLDVDLLMERLHGHNQWHNESDTEVTCEPVQVRDDQDDLYAPAGLELNQHAMGIEI